MSELRRRQVDRGANAGKPNESTSSSNGSNETDDSVLDSAKDDMTGTEAKDDESATPVTVGVKDRYGCFSVTSVIEVAFCL